MTGDHIQYEELAQEALRGVIREVLLRAEQEGLPGDHHFYIAFDTQADDVNISQRLKEQYPEEMTVVLQHQFWDLKVTDTYFEIKLSFNNIPETLVIPFNAIKVFFDPSVPYGLQFGAAAEMSHDETHAVLALPEIITDSDEQTTLLPPSASNPAPFRIAETSQEKDAGTDAQETEDTSNSDTEPDEDSQSAKVVELDAFRKNNNT